MAVYTIRQAHPDDAEALLRFIKTIADEPNNMIAASSSDDITYTLEEERDIILKHTEGENSNWFVAEAEGQLIGSSNLSAGRRGFYQTVSLGITVAKDWRERGIGTALMEHAIAWCKAVPTIHRLELEVFTINERAIHVYRKVGFLEEGIRQEAFLKHGQYLDVMLMGMIFQRE
jgi:RimJ/RimL family protein N-acetyltransferase